MWLLLKYQGYPTAVVVAFTLHGLLLYFVFGSSISSAEFIEIENVEIVTASVVQENPQRARQQEQTQRQRARVRQQRDEAATRDREQRQREAREEQAAADDAREQRELAEERDRVERQRLAQEERDRVEQERREQERRDERLAQEQADRQAAEERQVEAQRLAEQITAENQSIASYTSAINRAIGQFWSRPPSARNGMTVLLSIRLVPTGEVVAVDVIESSGDAAVDRSAVLAVRKVARFYDLEGMPIGLFERSFRNLNLNFKVEDMLR